MRQPFSRNAPGFTLVELMVVLVILSLVMGTLMPRIGAGWKRMDDREFLQEFIGTMRRARLHAMNSGEVVVFRINGAERRFDLELPMQKEIPENVDIFADALEQDPDTDDHMILFYPDGSLAGSDVEVAFDQQRYFLISINPLFGSIRVSQVEKR